MQELRIGGPLTGLTGGPASIALLLADLGVAVVPMQEVSAALQLAMFACGFFGK